MASALAAFACSGESDEHARSGHSGAGAAAGKGGASGNASDAAAGTAGTAGGRAGSGGALGSAGAHDGGGTSGTASATGGTSGATGGTADASGGAVVGSASCEDPKATIGIDGKDTGFVSCKAGFIHRPARRECASIIPRPPRQFPVDSTRNCERDQDCADLLHGYCTESPISIPQLVMVCASGCVRDEECGPDQICVCGDPVGTCISATCKTDADCGAGRFCVSSLFPLACYALPSPSGFACQSVNDSCRGPADCDPGWDCSAYEGRRSCIGAGRCG